MRYRVVEGASLVPSHDPSSFTPDPRYPAGVQGRRYHEDVAARESVAGGAMPGRFNPNKLIRDTGSASGTPVVTSEGVVIMGNQRTMMLQRLREHNPAGMGAYRQILDERAAQFGIDPASYQGMEFPVLVREADVDPTDTAALRRLNDLSDSPTTKARSALDEGAARAARLAEADASLAHFAETIDPDDTLRSYLSSSRGAAFVRALQRDGVISQAEMGRILSGDAVTADGKQLIEHMMYGSAIEDVNILTRARDVAAANLNKLDAGLPAIVSVNRAGGGYGLADDLQQALTELSNYRANGAFASLADFRGQGNLWAEESETIAKRLADLMEGPKADLTARLRKYAVRVAEATGSTKNNDLFGYTPPTPEALKAEIFGATKRPGVLANERGSVAFGAPGGPGFYSRLTNAAKVIKLDKAPAQTWISKLRGTASSADEFDWALGDALKADLKRQWTKAEIVKLAETRGYGALTETVRGEAPESWRWNQPAGSRVATARTEGGAVLGTATLSDDGRVLWESNGTRRIFPEWNDLNDHVEQMVGGGRAGGGRYGQYVEPGGTNYREVLLRVPDRSPTGDADAISRRFYGKPYSELTEAYQRVAVKREMNIAAPDRPKPLEFTSSHWDEPNVLAHIRMNDRVGPNGEKVLHVEEIQSDWHQRGRKEGYTQDTHGWTAEDLVGPNAGFTHWLVRDANGNEVTKIVGGDTEGAIRKAAEGIPNAPFKETPEWMGLAMKRVLDEAVAGGYDAVSWTPGIKQADRYSLRKVADEVRYNPKENLLTVWKDGEEIHSGTYDPKALPDVIGKEAADRLLASPLDEAPGSFTAKQNASGDWEIVNAAGRRVDFGYRTEEAAESVAQTYRKARAERAGHTLVGEQLEVGGEGMKAFYDEMLPNVVRGYTKKLGAPVDIEPGPSLRGDSQKHGRGDLDLWEDDPPDIAAMMFRVTPKLRTALSQGQSLGIGRAPILSTIAGAGVGSAVGASTGDTPEERRRNALLGALAGAAVGGGAELALGRLMRPKAGFFPGGKARLTPDQVDQIAAGKSPGLAPKSVHTPAEDYAHIASFATDPDGTIRLKEELRRAGPLNRGDPKHVESFEVVRHIANDLGFHDVMAGDVKRLNRSELLAIRDIVHTNLEHINANVRKLQTDPTLSAAERSRLAQLVEGMEFQNIALLDRFIVARGEMGRNLNALKILAASTMDPVVWLAKAQNAFGGPIPDEVRTAILAALQSGDRETLVKTLMDLRRSTTGEKFSTFWKANLLSNPMTHIINTTSNALLAGTEQAKNIPAAMADYLMGLANRQNRGQRTIAAYSSSLGRASREGAARGIRGALRTLRTGLDAGTMAKLDVPRQTNYESKILQFYTQSVFRTLGAEDQVFREVALSASLANQAEVMAKMEGWRGKQLRQRVEQLRLQPSDEMTIRAIADAEEAVVRDQTAIGKWLGQTSKLPGGKYVVPFTRTPGAIATRLAEYSPLYGLPVGAYKTGRVILQGLKNERVPIDVQREAAKLFGRGATGSAIVALGAYLAYKGLATGPAANSPKERATTSVTGQTPGSVKLGDFWTDVSRMTPVGMLLSLGAGMYNISQWKDATAGQKALGAGVAGAKVILNQPFLQGIQEATTAVNTLDPKRAVESAGEFSSRLAEGIVAGFIPMSSLLAAVARGVDPVVRQTPGLGGYLQSRLPGQSQKLPAAITPFGQENRRTGGMAGQLVNPLRQTEDRSEDPVVRAMIENDLQVSGLRRGKDETPEQFATRAMLEGKAAHQRLTHLLGTMRWRMAKTPEERQDLFDDAMREGRERGKRRGEREGKIPRVRTR